MKHKLINKLGAAALALALAGGGIQPPLEAGELTKKYDFYDLKPDFSPGYRPPAGGKRDEIGIWYYTDKAEEDLKESPFVIRDPELNAYVSEITCRLAGDHCPDIRVYIVETPHFNASMSPNGMMQIWSGLLLRTRSEAQLAAVIGHELGHYFRKHSINQWRKAKKNAAAANFLGVGGGGLISLLLISSIFAYTRDQEREADVYGVKLMLEAGYDPAEAARVWEQLVAEREANDDKERGMAMFRTHPSSDERMETLADLAAEVRSEISDYETYKERYVETLRAHRAAFMEDQLNFPKFDGTFYLIDDMMKTEAWQGELYYYKGEVHRRRGEEGDCTLALGLYAEALEKGAPPPEIWRSIGLCHLKNKDYAKARQGFETYLEAVPGAGDREMIEFYMEYGG